MVRVTEKPKKMKFLRPNVPADENVQADIARLTKAAGWEKLCAVIYEARERYFTNFARGMAEGGRLAKPADQREIDYLRGFWDGALWAIEKLPYMTSAAYDAFVEEALKEAEALERDRD